MLLTRVLKNLFSSGERPMNDEHEPARPGPATEGYAFTVDWFSGFIPVWTQLIAQYAGISKILEIGSYEGRSTVWLIHNAFPPGRRGEIFCVDSWQGGVEHDAAAMGAIEQRFLHNVEVARSRGRPDITVHPLKGISSDRLAALIAAGHGLSFDLVYVDGSHQCPDVLSDLVMGFQLCRVGGLMICDDYLWSLEEHGREDLLNAPKLAIDSFVNCYRRRLHVSSAGLSQLYIEKTAT